MKQPVKPMDLNNEPQDEPKPKTTEPPVETRTQDEEPPVVAIIIAALPNGKLNVTTQNASEWMMRGMIAQAFHDLVAGG